MRPKPWPRSSLALVLASVLALPLAAQQHRATRLGNPETRFASPLTSPEQLRSLLTREEMQADVAAILDQAGWRGDLADFRAAAASNEIYEIRIHPGTIMPFMSARERGRPKTLMEVLWAGKAPVEAYAFLFTSRGQRYRCVTPKPCSNFFVEDLGREPKPSLRLTKEAPSQAGLCAPFDVVVTVTNTSRVPLRQVRVSDQLPAGLKMADGAPGFDWDAGDIPPGEARAYRASVQAETPGTYVNRARVTAAEGLQDEASATTVVRAPVLSIDCAAPGQTRLGQPVEVCLTVNNVGDAAEPRATVTLPLPEAADVTGVSAGGQATATEITWDLGSLEPAASRKLCATFNPRGMGTYTYAPTASGTCAKAVRAECVSQALGIPAILLEVVDLEDPVTVGGTVTYEIRVTNQGTAPGTNIRLICTCPELEEYVSGTGDTAISAQERVAQTDVLPVLAPKAQAVWRITTKALAAGDARFKVQLISDQFKQPIPEEEATTLY